MDTFIKNGTLSNTSETVCHFPDNAPHPSKDIEVSKVLMIVAILFMIVLGLIGNSLMCFALCSTSHLRKLANIFTINLGITDLGIVCFIMPMWIVSMVQGNSAVAQNVQLRVSLCKFTSFLTLTLVFVSVATLACISFDRYVCICHPLKYPRKVTVMRVTIVLIYIWIQGILLASTPLYGWGCYTFKPMSLAICNNLWVYSTSYSLLCFVVGLVIPFVIMVASNVCIFQVARKQARRIQAFTMELVNPWGQDTEQTKLSIKSLAKDGDCISPQLKVGSPNQKQNSSNFTSISKSLKTLKAAFIVVGIFIICWVPYVTMQFWSANHTDDPIASEVEFVCTFFAFSNSCVNPLVFMLLTRDLRLRIKNLFKKLRTTVFSSSRNTVGVAGKTHTKQIHWPFLGHKTSVQVIHLGQRSCRNSSSYYSSEDEEDSYNSEQLPKLAEALFGVSQLFGGINERQILSNSTVKTEKTTVAPAHVNTTSCCFHEKENPPVFSTAVTVGL